MIKLILCLSFYHDIVVLYVLILSVNVNVCIYFTGTMSLLQKLDLLPVGNVSMLWVILRDYLSKKDISKLIHTTNPFNTLRLYLRDLYYYEKCPVCREGYWTYKTKKKMNWYIKRCFGMKDRLRVGLCSNRSCDPWKIYGYVPYIDITTQKTNIDCFQKTFSQNRMDWYKTIDEESRSSFVRYQLSKEKLVNPYQESIDSWWR